jgi:hypothetical protein
MCSHDDHSAVALGGDPNDFRYRVSVGQPMFQLRHGTHCLQATKFLSLLVQKLLDNPGSDRVTSRDQDRWRNDVQDDQPGSMISRKRACEPEGGV